MMVTKRTGHAVSGEEVVGRLDEFALALSEAIDFRPGNRTVKRDSVWTNADHGAVAAMKGSYVIYPCAFDATKVEAGQLRQC